jgi:hypothetical protein
MVIAVFGVTNNASTWSAESCATLGALAENIDYTRSSILSFAVASAVQATAGATGASTATPSVAGGNNGVLFSLAPIRQYTSAVKLSVSWDGGTSWSSAQTTSLTGTYIASTDNFTGAVSWTPAMLNDGTFQVKALTQTGTSVETVNLDWLPVVVTYTVPPSITDSPSSIDIGLVKPGQTYYASGSAYSNPVTAGQCTFTVTNTGSAPCGISLQCSNATGGNSWTLVSGTPSGDQFKVIAVYAGEDPASGLVLTTSPQTFDASLATSGTLQWDFMEIMGGLGGAHGTFSDANQKTFSLTLVAY